MSLGGKARPARKADDVKAICEPIVVGSSASHNPIGLHGCHKVTFIFHFFKCI
jgi:hypothetical protein